MEDFERFGDAPVLFRAGLELLGSSRELILVHRDAEYRLRLTRNDKLILTK